MTASLAYELTELTELRNGTNETNGNQQKTDSFFLVCKMPMNYVLRNLTELESHENTFSHMKRASETGRDRQAETAGDRWRKNGSA